jgi:putative ABC transport system permease protein
MRPLHRKLVRDMWKLRGQLVAIVAVVACGIAAYVTMLSVHASLRDHGQAYFERNRLPDVFARTGDAPLAVARRIEALPWVEAVEARVVEDVVLDVRGLAEPAVGRLVSITTDRPPVFNEVYLRTGRMPRSGSTKEAVANEAFVQAHRLAIGEEVHVIVGGRRQTLRIVGVGLSPEYVYTVTSSGLPDDKRFGVFWMDARGLAAISDMEGRVNDISVSLAKGASQQQVIDVLDRILEPYGSRGAHGRDRQMSARFVSEELKQLENMGAFVPMLFLGVATFLLNVVMSRLVDGQREQIAALKALGYGNLTIGVHFVQLVMLVVLLGTAVGAGLGAVMGDAMVRLYHQYFRFPALEFSLRPQLLVSSAALAAGAGLLGTFVSVRRAVALPPAEAMRPPSPPTYRRGPLTRLGLPHVLGPAGRIVLRNVERRPLRTLLASLGLAMGVGIMVAGTFSMDALAYVMDVNYERIQRDDLTVSFAHALPRRALRDLESTPGVLYAEPMRQVPVRIRAGHRDYQTMVEGLDRGARLRQLLDAKLRPVPLPPNGVILTDVLAERLGVRPGDSIDLEILEGSERTRRVLVAGTIDEMMGMSAYMDLAALDQLMNEGPLVSGARLLLDPMQRDVAYHHIKRLPKVAGASLRKAAYDLFNESTGQIQTVTAMILGAFASVVTIGVVYNSARVILAERARELASLRVLGFTRREVSGVLLGELFVQLLLAVPMGCALGYLFAFSAIQNVDAELYRFPLIIYPKTYLLAVSVVLVAGVVTGLFVRRQVDHLDLVAVLKTRE